MRYFIYLIGLLFIGVSAAIPAHAQLVCGDPANPCKTTKTASEVINLSFDFANRAANGITVVSVTAVNVNKNTDASSQIISASPAPSVISQTEKVFFQVKGGAVGDRYNLSIKVSKTDTAELLEGNVSLSIVSGL